MFERYTESARRALFYARHEASELGAHSIDTEHLLLGLLREPKGITAHLLADFGVRPEPTRRELATRFRTGERIPTSVELPFTAAAMKVLELASSQAESLQHSYVGTEHVLLGLLQGQEGPAAGVLSATALELNAVRERLVQLLGESTPTAADRREIRHIDDRIELAKSLVMRLANTPSGTTEARELVQRIQDTLDALRADFSE